LEVHAWGRNGASRPLTFVSSYYSEPELRELLVPGVVDAK
jgi:hypothetical protein